MIFKTDFSGTTSELQPINLEKAFKAMWLMEVTLIKKGCHQGKGEDLEGTLDSHARIKGKRSIRERESRGEVITRKECQMTYCPCYRWL